MRVVELNHTFLTFIPVHIFREQNSKSKKIDHELS